MKLLGLIVLIQTMDRYESDLASFLQSACTLHLQVMLETVVRQLVGRGVYYVSGSRPCAMTNAIAAGGGEVLGVVLGLIGGNADPKHEIAMLTEQEGRV